MTEKRTLALNSRQWRVLLHDNLEQLKAGVLQAETINEQALRDFYARLEDIKMLAGAWFQVSQPQEPKAADVPATANGAHTNGAEPVVKKRRGRPSNAELAARQAVQ